jgi:hypothetical protein
VRAGVTTTLINTCYSLAPSKIVAPVQKFKLTYQDTLLSSLIAMIWQTGTAILLYVLLVVAIACCKADSFHVVGIDSFAGSSITTTSMSSVFKGEVYDTARGIACGMWTLV